MTVPTNVVLVPSVAELPTCQNTLQGCAPLIRRTAAAGRGDQRRAGLEDEDGVGVALASRVTVPVRAMLVEAGRRPGEGLAAEVAGGPSRTGPAGGVVVRRGEVACAWSATASAAWMLPLMTSPGREAGDGGAGADAEVAGDDGGPGVGDGRCRPGRRRVAVPSPIFASAAYAGCDPATIIRATAAAMPPEASPASIPVRLREGACGDEGTVRGVTTSDSERIAGSGFRVIGRRRGPVARHGTPWCQSPVGQPSAARSDGTSTACSRAARAG